MPTRPRKLQRKNSRAPATGRSSISSDRARASGFRESTATASTAVESSWSADTCIPPPPDLVATHRCSEAFHNNRRAWHLLGPEAEIEQLHRRSEAFHNNRRAWHLLAPEDEIENLLNNTSDRDLQNALARDSLHRPGRETVCPFPFRPELVLAAVRFIEEVRAGTGREVGAREALLNVMADEELALQRYCVEESGGVVGSEFARCA